MPHRFSAFHCRFGRAITGFAAPTLLGAGLGLAAGLTLDAGTKQPVPEPEPADASGYARICEAFGEGFTYSPTTGACIKIGGYVKFGTSFGGATRQGPRPGTEKFQLR